MRSSPLLIELGVSDIAKQGDLDVVVNSANRRLRLGSGVAGAIHGAAGPEMEEYLRAFAPLGYGKAVLSPGFKLPTPWVIHACASSFLEEDDALEHLQSCIRLTLRLASDQGFNRIGFPAIGTGVFRCPIDVAATTFAEAMEALSEQETCIRLVRFCLPNSAAMNAFASVFDARGLSYVQLGKKS